MGLLSIQIEDFRCLHDVRLDLGERTTLIQGPNGSGKSSLLEAIYLLGRGRSFRANRLNSVIRDGASLLRVIGRVSADRHIHSIGIEARRHQLVARIDAQPVTSLAELSMAFPVQVIEPGVHKLIEEGPIRRRRYLDWGVFHVEQPYLECWQRFHRVVKQRNAALKANASDAEIDSWDLQFVKAGEQVSVARAGYVDALKPFVLDALSKLFEGHGCVELSYFKGWPEGKNLHTALLEARLRDRQRKVSTLGPQRADFLVLVSDAPAREVVSRGQQKLLASALVIGQLAYHAQHFGMQATVLLDDPSAELDRAHVERFISEVRQLKAQIVVSSLQADSEAFGVPERVFHVERGTVTEV